MRNHGEVEDSDPVRPTDPRDRFCDKIVQCGDHAVVGGVLGLIF